MNEYESSSKMVVYHHLMGMGNKWSLSVGFSTGISPPNYAWGFNHQSLGIGYSPWTTGSATPCKGQRVIDVRLLYILINREEIQEIQEIQLQLIQDDNGLGSFPLGPAKWQMVARIWRVLEPQETGQTVSIWIFTRCFVSPFKYLFDCWFFFGM